MAEVVRVRGVSFGPRVGLFTILVAEEIDLPFFPVVHAVLVRLLGVDLAVLGRHVGAVLGLQVEGVGAVEAVEGGFLRGLVEDEDVRLGGRGARAAEDEHVRVACIFRVAQRELVCVVVAVVGGFQVGGARAAGEGGLVVV